MSYYRFLILVVLLTLTVNAGCEVLPTTRFKPTLHNPLPQLRNIAVVPFYNTTGNPNIDSRRFAACFANELQRVPGFNVISNDVVEKTMLAHNIYRFENVDDVRYLAQLLKVDGIVIGKIHYFNDHYPPKVKFETEWYAVNPYFHPIPAGRGLPWGTEHEEFIPDKLLLQAEMELAAAQLETQTPKYEPVKRSANGSTAAETGSGSRSNSSVSNSVKAPASSPQTVNPQPPQTANRKSKIILMSAAIPNNMEQETESEAALDDLAKYRQQRYMNQNLALTGVPYIPEAEPYKAEDQKKDKLLKQPHLGHPFQQGPWQSETAQAEQNPWSAQNQYLPYQQGQLSAEIGIQSEKLAEKLTAANENEQNELAASLLPLHSQLPPNWPDPKGFIPESPLPERPKGEIKNDGPIITHISMYNGNDSEFMQALQDYDFLFRDDKRLAGKESILNNGTEFISFCCRMHIWEIFTARGGAGQAEKVKRFYKIWKGGERPY